MSILSRDRKEGLPAWRLENDAVCLVVIPEAGGKIVSLLDKRADYEWLIQPAQSNPFRLLPPGTVYNDEQVGGWDEMCPTILAGPYPAPGPYLGRGLPDHGELWTMAWQDAGTGDGAIRLAAAGQVLPYTLERTLSLVGPAALRLEYILRNTGAAPLHYLWAAHPQFACEPGARIVLPPQTAEVINVMPASWGPEWGEPGTRNPWPEKPGAGRQDIVSDVTRKGGRKFYLPPDVAHRVGRAGTAIRRLRAAPDLGCRAAALLRRLDRRRLPEQSARRRHRAHQRLLRRPGRGLPQRPRREHRGGRGGAVVGGS